VKSLENGLAARGHVRENGGYAGPCRGVGAPRFEPGRVAQVTLVAGRMRCTQRPTSAGGSETVFLARRHCWSRRMGGPDRLQRLCVATGLRAACERTNMLRTHHADADNRMKRSEYQILHSRRTQVSACSEALAAALRLTRQIVRCTRRRPRHRAAVSDNRVTGDGRAKISRAPTPNRGRTATVQACLLAFNGAKKARPRQRTCVRSDPHLRHAALPHH
jgi:hypothetical protein